MGLLDEFSESPDQEKDKRATKEGLREAREGGTFSKILDDVGDELGHGRDYLNRKVATREGAKEAARGDNVFDNLISDTHDEVVHGPEYVARKKYYREKSVESSSAESSSNYGGGGGSASGDVLAKGALITFLVIVFFIISIPLGLFLRWKEKRDAIAAIGTVRMNVSIKSEDIDESRAIRYAHGQPQTITIYINWQGPLYESGKPLRVTVSRNRVIYYDRLWKHDELAYFDRFACEVRNILPTGRYIVRASVEGAPPAEYAFMVQPRPPGDIFVSDNLFNGWPQNRLTNLVHRPGENQKIYIGASLRGALLGEGRVVYVALLHEGVPMFNSSYRVKEQSRNFYLPYEYDFAPGSYTARLSAVNEPPAEFTFKVEYPTVETLEEKNLRVKRFLDAVLPGSHPQAR